MPASRRTISLIAVAAVLLVAFAVLPAPRLIFRRSPIVSDRVAGDVRRVAMAVEPDGSMHAALEVWTDSDWDIEYWSSITGLTPVARVVTIDFVEQRDTAIAMAGSRLALAWVEHDAKAEHYALRVTTKQRIDRNWAKPVTVAEGPRILREPSVAIDDSGRAVVAFVRGGDLALAEISAAGVVRSGDGSGLRDVRRPAIALGPGASGLAVVFEAAQSVHLLRVSASGGLTVERDAAVRLGKGSGPAVAPTEAGFTVAWAERDAIVVREGDEAPRRVAAPGLGDVRPSIALSGGNPVAVWARGGRVVSIGLPGGARTLASSRTCCAAVAARGGGIWTSWLESRPVSAIDRGVRLLYQGPAGRFTRGDRIPVTALPASSG